MSNLEVLVAPLNSVEMNGSGQVEAISNIISTSLLGAENTPPNNQKSNQITTPQKKKSKHTHKKKLTVAERLARCAITNNRVILDVEPDAKHKKKGRRRKVRTYNTYEEYELAKKMNPDESDILSPSEFEEMKDEDTSECEEIVTLEKDMLDDAIFEENKEEDFELLSHPHILCDITPNRNSCYDDVAVSIDRGMPGNALEKDIEEQEARELKEHEEDLQYYALMHYPESPLEIQLGLNFNSDLLRNDFGAGTALNESAFSIAEMNSDVISMSPRSPRGIGSKMRNVCNTGIVTLLSVGPDEEKVAEYQEQKSSSKHFTHVRKYHTTDKTNELNESLGPMAGSISNIKLVSKSTLAILSDEERAEEERIKNSENDQLQDALMEENANHVLERRGMSYSSSNLSNEYFDLTIYSDEEKIKNSEDDHLRDELDEEAETIQKQKDYKKQQKLIREQEEEMERLELLQRIAGPDMPPNDITPNGDGTTDVGIQTVRCNIENLMNRRPSRKSRRRKQYEMPEQDYIMLAIQPRVLLNIQPDRNSCYDNINDSIDRGMPGNPLEDEIEELEALQEKERLNDLDYYNSTIYNERSMKEQLKNSHESDALRDEFGNRPIQENISDIIVEEEEEAEYASQSEPEEPLHHELEPPPLQDLSKSPRIRRRVKKPVLKESNIQCELVTLNPIDKLSPLPPIEINENPEPTERNFVKIEENQQKIVMGQLGEQIDQALTEKSQNIEEKNDNNAGYLEETMSKTKSLFQNLNNNDEGEQKESSINPISQTLEKITDQIEENIDENQEQTTREQNNIIQPLKEPISQALENITDKLKEDDDSDNIQPLENPVEKTLSTITDQIEYNQKDTSEVGQIQSLPLGLLKLTNPNNDASEMSDNQRIQMPSTDADSSGISPRTKSTRQGVLRSKSKNGYRSCNSPRSPRYGSIKNLKERAMRLEPITNATNEQLELLIVDIERDKKILNNERRFKDGLKCTAAIQHVKSILKQQNSSNIEPEAAFNEESFEKEQQLLEKQENARRKLKEKHRKERDNLSKQWNSIQIRKKYNKPSDKLVEMKKQYDAMIASGNPDETEEANKLLDEINQLRQLETEEAHQRMQRDYDTALFNLQEKQHQDIALLHKSNQYKMELLKQQREKDKRTLDFKRTRFANSPIVNADENNLLNAQSEKFVSDGLSNLFDLSDKANKTDNDETEKLILPPLDTRRPKTFRFAKPDSS